MVTVTGAEGTFAILLADRLLGSRLTRRINVWEVRVTSGSFRVHLDGVHPVAMVDGLARVVRTVDDEDFVTTLSTPSGRQASSRRATSLLPAGGTRSAG